MMTTLNKIAHIYNPANMSPQELIDNFVVRQNEFRRLYTALKDAPMEYPEQHYIVVGPRGSGKSTLLQRLYYEIQRDPEMNWRVTPVLLPEEQYQIVHLAGLWETVLEMLDHEAEYAGVYADFEAGLGEGDEEEYRFSCLVRALRSRGRKLILFLENIGDLLVKFTKRDHQRLRERLLTSADLRIVGGSAVVLEHTHQYSEPLFGFFRFEYLRELNRQEVNALLSTLARSYREERVARILREQTERVEVLRRLTGGIPRTIVLLFEIFADEERGDSYRDLEQVLDRVTPLYKHRMDDLAPASQQIVDCLAMNWDAMTVPEVAAKLRIDITDAGLPGALQTDIESLVKNGLIQRVAEPAREPLYQIAERFFNIWYLMRYGRRNDRNRVRWFVRFLEAWCDPEDLAARARKHLAMLQERNVDLVYHDCDAAERYFRQALEADPTHANTLGNYADFLEVQRDDYDAAEGYYLRASEQGDNWSMRRLVRMCLTHGRSREVALKYSTVLVETSQEMVDRFRHGSVLVWNRRVDEAIVLADATLTANPELEPLDQLRDFLLMLIAAGAYGEAWRLFVAPKFQLRDRYRPVYYALLRLDSERDPAASARMGGEFKETVEELVGRIKQWRETYFVAPRG